MTDLELKEALREERQEIADLVGNWWFPWWTPEESEEVMKELTDAIRKRDCRDFGHVRGIPTNQIDGRELCGHCRQEILFPKLKAAKPD